MESAGSAVVDFGRFCTAFLVVMGIGMRESLSLSRTQSAPEIIWKYRVLIGMRDSSTDSLGSYWPHRGSGHGHVYHWWSADLRHHHKLHFIFPRRAGLLGGVEGFILNWRGLQARRHCIRNECDSIFYQSFKDCTTSCLVRLVP